MLMSSLGFTTMIWSFYISVKHLRENLWVGLRVGIGLGLHFQTGWKYVDPGTH